MGVHKDIFVVSRFLILDIFVVSRFLILDYISIERYDEEKSIENLRTF
jgi:hypothetical protein